MGWFPAILRSFFHSTLLCALSFHPFPPTSLPSFLTSSCHPFLGLPPSLVACKFIYNTSWEFYVFSYFLPFFVHAQTNVIYLTLYIGWFFYSHLVHVFMGSVSTEGLSIVAFMLCLFSNPCSFAAFCIFLGKLSLPAMKVILLRDPAFSTMTSRQNWH